MRQGATSPAVTSQTRAGSRDVLVVEEVNDLEPAGEGFKENPAPGPGEGSEEAEGTQNQETISEATEPVEGRRGSSTMGKGTDDLAVNHVGSTVTLIDETRDEAIEKAITVDPTSSKAVESAPNDSNYVTVSGQKAGCLEVIRRRHLVEKLVFVTSVMSLLTLACSLVTSHWLLPYYYTVFAPVLIVIRFIMYWKLKWQLFLFDFCYFGNILCYIFIWAVPDNWYVFSVLFAISNGPLAWAIPVFRNSLVFHSIDKMTSTFIHTLPLFITYGVRWFPPSTSLYWYKPFLNTFPEDLGSMFIYMVGVPFGCFLVHSLVSILLIFVIVRPSEKYLHTYSYLTENARFTKLFCLGPKFKPIIFYGTNWLVTLLTMLGTILFYKYFIAHTVALAVFMFVALWNGSSFYMDKFAYKGHTSES